MKCAERDVLKYYTQREKSIKLIFDTLVISRRSSYARIANNAAYSAAAPRRRWAVVEALQKLAPPHAAPAAPRGWEVGDQTGAELRLAQQWA